jgi:peptide deformylase
MSALPIVVVPHVALGGKAKSVQNIDDRIVKLAHSMAETMYRAPGLGLAANQIGELVRLIVVDLEYAYAEPKNKKKNPLFIINPKICESEGESFREEGCLSVPEFGIEITRAEAVEVQGVDLTGKQIRMAADGLLARVLQHEIDHLNGTTILDHASPLKRTLYQRKLRKRGRRSQ